MAINRIVAFCGDFAAILRRFCAKSTQFNGNLAEIELNLAQGGLSVAGGCRCLTKELDMIAC